MMRKILSLVACLALPACVDAPREVLPPLSPTMSGQEARELFGAEQNGSEGSAEVIGGYANGCVAGAVQLAENGPTWQSMRLSRNRHWGHPELIDYIQDLSRTVAETTTWDGIYVGDMSQPRGGPMLTGHRSHQSGLDVDFWMLPARRLDLSVTDRENLSSISTRRASGAYTGENWTDEHWQVIRAAASDPRVARIFVFPGAKVYMCENETGNRDYLRRIRPWWGHHYHFHVRLNCPSGSPDCVEQAAVPPGDGCDEAREWVDRILGRVPAPPPDPNAVPAPPRRELTLGDLPRQCASILSFETAG